MSFDKLPPGVKPSDIPGNRPIDEEYRKILDEVKAENPELSEHEAEDRAQERLESRF